MKKNIFAFVLFSTSFMSLFAQTGGNDFRDRIQLGAKVGANLSNVYDGQGQDFVADSKFGLAAGLFARIPLNEFIGLQPEILFSQKGFSGKGTLLGGNYNFNKTTNYIDIPLFVSIKPAGFFTILAGLQYSYLIKQSYVFTTGSNSVFQEKEFNNDNVRKNILCFTGGADINIEHFVIGARAGWDFQNNNGDGTSETPRYKNAWYQLTLGYRIY